MSKFKVGDRVRVTFGMGWDGDGTIVLVADGDNVNVRMDDGRVGGFFTRCVELLPVAPQQAGPVRTVTRREIVPGVYDAVWIGREEYAGKARLELRRTNLSPSELREAARIFNEIADVLEEGE